MGNMIPLDGATRVEVQDASTGRIRYYHKGRSSGLINVERITDRKALIAEGLATPASATGPVMHLPGYRCPACERRNYFKTCGRCGCVEGTKEDGNQ